MKNEKLSADSLFAGTLDLPEFEFNGHQVAVTVHKSGISMEFLESVQHMEAAGETMKFCQNLADIVVGWNISDLEPTAEVFYKLDSGFVTTLLETMTEVMVGNSQKPGK